MKTKVRLKKFAYSKSLHKSGCGVCLFGFNCLEFLNCAVVLILSANFVLRGGFVVFVEIFALNLGIYCLGKKRT